MMIPFTCQTCRETYSTDSSRIGKQIRCSHCFALSTVPEPPEKTSSVSPTIRWLGIACLALIVPTVGITLVWLANNAEVRRTNPETESRASDADLAATVVKIIEEPKAEGVKAEGVKDSASRPVTVPRNSDLKPSPNLKPSSNPVPLPKAPFRRRAGPTPEPSSALPLSPEQTIILDTLRKYANDPASVEVVEWRPVAMIDLPTMYPSADRAVYLVVRQRNGFGGLSTGGILVFMRGTRILGSISPDLDPFNFNWQMAKVYKDREADPLGRSLFESFGVEPNRGTIVKPFKP